MFVFFGTVPELKPPACHQAGTGTDALNAMASKPKRKRIIPTPVTAEPLPPPPLASAPPASAAAPEAPELAATELKAWEAVVKALDELKPLKAPRLYVLGRCHVTESREE